MSLKRFIKFCAVGASGVVVNEGLLLLLTEFAGFFYLVSSPIAIEISIITNFILNDVWTFKDRAREQRSVLGRGVRFNAVSAGGLVINMAVLFSLVSMGFYYLYANLVGILCAVLWNYIVNLKWTWSESSFGGFKLQPVTQTKSDDETVSIIIPTYNESDNIRKIIPEIFAVFRAKDINGEVVVIDDNSPDKTWQIAEDLGKEYNVKSIRRVNERGLSSAVVRGFKEASGNLIGVMDADLSHPTDAIPDMIEPLRSGTELVIGSRYVSGGGIENWPAKRKVISKGATMLARGLTKIKDPMSGFFFFRREIIDGVKLNPTGYKIGLEVLVKGKHKTVKEVPYTFKDRAEGESKMGTREIINYLMHLAKLYGYKVRNV